MKFSLPTHPETPRQLLTRSVRWYRQATGHVFFLALFLSFTVFLPGILSLIVGQDVFLSLPIYSIQRFWLFFIDLAALIFFVAMLWRIHCLMIHKHESLEEDLKVGLIKVPSILIASLVQGILIICAVFLISSFIYYGILGRTLDLTGFTLRTYFAVFFFFVLLSLVIFIFLSFYFYLPLIVLENKGIFTSLAKSFRLVWKHWLLTVYVQSIPWLGYFLSLVFVKLAINLNINIFFLYQTPTQNGFDLICQILLFALFIPWIAITLMLQLKDLELRKQLRFKSYDTSVI